MDTSTVQDRKAPSAGTKVSGGPAVRETAGNVPSESLAAESYREGGGFSANPGISENSTSRSGGTQLDAAPNADARESSRVADMSSSEQYAEAAGRTRNQQPDSYAGTAPSYVGSQYQQDSGAPHGKNLSEGDWDESQARDGLRKALASEPGSRNDPSRLAEQQFQQSAPVGSGPREDGLSKGSAFDNLDRETSS